MTPQKEKITALIITYNEIGYIEKCIRSVGFADEIIVVDSHSTDGTYEYLLNHPKVRVLQNPFENFTAQKSYALRQATHDWVLFLDADEVVPEKLQNEIIKTIHTNKEDVAYWFYRKFMFKNRPLRFSGWQTDKNYRLFRKSRAHFSDKKIVHETLEVNGSSGILNERLIHFSYKTYTDYRTKMLYYGKLKAKQAISDCKHFNYLKLFLKPTWKFFVNYFIRLGVLDGKKGIIICYLNALSDLERYQQLRQLERKRGKLSKTSVIFRNILE